MGDNGCPKHEEHEWRLRALEETLKGIPERVKAAEESTKSAHHRADALAEQNKALLDLTGSVKVIASKMEDLVDTVKDHGDAIQTLQRAPGDELLEISKRAKMQMVDRVVAAMVGAAIALVVLIPQLLAMAQKAKEVTP